MSTRLLSSAAPDRVAAVWDAEGLGILEGAVTGFASAADLLDGSAWANARREEIADRVVDVIAVRAWHALPQLSHGRARRVARRCIAYSLAADTVRADGSGTARADCWTLTTHALELLTIREHFDAAAHRSRELLGVAPRGRLLAAWQMVDDALGALGTTRHEWVGADPATVAAAGWVLVDRMSRLLMAAALVAQSAAASAGDAELLVNAARRYAWNHLRRPAPEAATPTHVQRSADLVHAFLTPGSIP
ncbi:hypothetical protein ACVH9Z_15580 [Rhodococcus opacus]|uniref:hypothetical protein n=1 Tax=Rhodococcus TaxID=1827 RepID=UPI0002A33B6F|nr:hypothetical protein [Rhodococcus opacus]ELB91746.1 hypothetical protein Rwratislav_17679 [Rhodococcus wratislaviensis IFP 2016]NHU45887.1 hypothetical protein [Rhodococcus sp. A14]MDX5967574.1 hypothetical protein [Rhodococcus opacus]NKY76092.1 hypothetical protein [Rhodococcus opacus]QZS58983.1 hypothetical protein FXW36_19130 [Rhodococcus opacus]